MNDATEIEIPRDGPPWKGPPPPLSLAGLPSGGQLAPAHHHYLLTVKALEDLVTSMSAFDRRSFDTRRRGSSSVLDDLRARLVARGRPIPQDLLVRLAEPATDALRKIAAAPKVRMKRTYEQMLPAKVRIQDTRCLMKLARVPGRDLREKTSVARKVPAVRRNRSVDTAENRLAKRVAMELGRAARARLDHERRHPDLLADDLERLEALHAVCQLFDQDDFSELRRSVRPEPNNALLGHPDYNRVWRIFRTIRKRSEYFAELWGHAHEWVPRLTAWAVCSLVVGADDAFATEGIVGTSMSGAAPVELEQGRVKFILESRSSAPRAITVQPRERSVEVVVTELQGETVLRGSRSERYSFHLDLRTEIPGPWDSSRGLPLEVLGQLEGSDSLYAWEGAADLRGLRDLASSICDRTGLPSVSERNGTSSQPARQLGVDLHGPAPIVADEATASFASEPALAAAADEFIDGSAPVLLGSHASLALEGDWRITELGQVMSTLDGEVPRELLPDAGKIVAHVLRRRTNLSTQLAFATPDDLDEVGMRALRDILPGGTRAWLVWRSVAAAMAWRANGGATAVQEEDIVVVIDAGAESCTASLLIGRTDPEKSDDNWYWERRAVFERLEASTPTLTTSGLVSQLSEFACGDWSSVSDQDATRRRLLHDPGLFELIRRRTSGTVRAPCLDAEGNPGLATATVSEELLSGLSEGVVDQLDAWLRAFIHDHHALEKIQKYVENSQLHVLLVGTPFGLADEEDLRRVVRKHIPAAHCTLPADPAGLVARGCAVFLSRHGRGLPTWRDIIPDLDLVVSTSAGQRRISLLDEKNLARGVRPGQVLRHSSPQTFQLPSGMGHLDLPLASGEAEGRQLEMHTVVEHEALPLDDPVEVRLHVNYRYAEDAFRLYLRPVEDAPFAEIEVMWSRGEVEGGGPPVKNLVPQFPPPQGWDNCDVLLERLGREYDEILERMQFFDPTKKKKSTTRNRIKAAPDDVLDDLRQLSSQTSDLTAEIAELLPPGRIIDDAPEHGARLLGECATLLASLAGIQSNSIRSRKRRKKSRRKVKPPIRRRIWGVDQLLREAGSKAQPAVDDLERTALIALSRLRSQAPGFAVDFLIALIAAGQAESWDFEALGRMLGTPDGDRGEAFESVLEDLASFLDMQTERASDLPGLRHRLWALATAFWTSESAVLSLGNDQAELLSDISTTIARAIANEWHEEGVAIELFNELGLVILALLRRRKPEDPTTGFLHAEGDTSLELADLTEQIDRELRDHGYSSEPRIHLDIPAGGDERSPFAALLADTLRGHRVALIQLKED